MTQKTSVRFTIDLSPQMHKDLPAVAARLGKRKAVLARIPIAQLLKDADDNVVVR